MMLFRKAHLIFYQFLIAIFFFAFYPLFYYLSRKEDRYVWLNRLRQLWSSFAFIFSGILYRIRYEEALDPARTYIFCANHTSHLDVPFMCIIGNRKFHFMGKAELLTHPVMGVFFRTIDIPVHRGSKMGSFRAFVKAAENLEKGMSLMVFPEGKIPDNAPHLHKFKDGPFRLAVQKKIPIVPVTFADNWRLLPDDGKEKGSRPGFTRVFIHKPIETSKMTEADIEPLKNDVYSQIKEKFEQANMAMLQYSNTAVQS